MLLAADNARRNGRWHEAEQHYLTAKNSTLVAPELMARVNHNLALCALSRGDFQTGADYSLVALQAEPALWVAGLVHAKCQRGLGHVGEARTLLEALKRQLVAQGDEDAQDTLNGELADILLNDFGDPKGARALHPAPHPGGEPVTLDAELSRIASGFYDGDSDSPAMVRRINQFAKTYLTRQAVAPVSGRLPHSGGRLRVGLISPFFSRSPVYYLCIGALARLASANELILFNRATKADHATADFRQLASQWHDCAAHDAEQLQQTLQDAQLDVLIDMGGWSDVLALQALAAKPARALYKWVGGQAASTGMQVFDGFITDSHQSPESSTAQHTEPLARLPHGYVTYTPPAYLPRPQPAPADQIILGVVANPAKLSDSFMSALRAAVPTIQARASLRLRFIDRRLQLPAVTGRLREALGADVAIAEFIAPRGHDGYLYEVGQLTAVLDTFPYSSGLTALEALAMGVPVIDFNPTPIDQRLFCGRHAYSHGHFARQGNNALPPWLTLAALLDLPDDALFGHRPRHSYLTDSPRADHHALANDIQNLINPTGMRLA